MKCLVYTLGSIYAFGLWYAFLFQVHTSCLLIGWFPTSCNKTNTHGTKALLLLSYLFAYALLG